MYKKLDETINKKLGELFIEADVLVDVGYDLLLYRYSITLAKNDEGKYGITNEKLSSKKAVSKKESMETL